MRASDGFFYALRRSDHGIGFHRWVIGPIVLHRGCLLASQRVELFEIAVLMGGERHPRLNISGNPIAKKYREGKLKSTLERE